MSKKKGKPVNHVPMRKEEILIREKGKRLVEAEKEYWQEQKRLRENLNAAAPAFMEGHNELLPADISSMVWLLRDGAAFVRYKTEGAKPGVQWRVLNVTLEEWARRGWIVPVGGKDISLTGFISGLGNATFYKCRFNDIFIEYASFSHVRYDGPRLNPSIAEALLEFRLAVLGMTLQQLGTISSPPQGIFMPREDIVKELKSRIDQFRRLLLESAKEEEFQVFLKENPFLLQPGAIVIPKKKLGEDFVTDFVIVTVLDQGRVYTLVELEGSSHKIFTSQGLSSEVNHAISQTVDWDTWIEKNKAYIREKLPGFESPKYLVVIGRTAELDDSDKERLRSYNRMCSSRLQIRSYDDLIVQAERLLEDLSRISVTTK